MLGSTLKTYMKKRGIKQTYVASVTKIPPQVLGQILNENRKLEASEYFKICSAVNADPVRLAEESGIWEQDKAAQLVLTNTTHRRRRERKHEVWGRIDPGT